MTAASPFHAGEIAVQEQAGVAERAARSGAHSIRDHLIEQHRDFYPLLPMLFAGFVDDRGRPWASMLKGAPGFCHALNDRQLRISATPAPGDPLLEALRTSLPLGCLGLQWETRRRNRVNGVAGAVGATGFTLDVVHAFGNCPKYIQTRRAAGLALTDTRRFDSRGTLTADDAALIARADTFFIASAVARHVDVSHRGGKPGFLRLEGDGALVWPDYPGNNFFNTLGNIQANPAAGLLVPDWETGAVLQMTGRAYIRWNGDARAVVFQPTAVHFSPNIMRRQWALVEQSPFLDRLKD